MGADDMDVLDFARSISMLSINAPISIRFDEEYGQKKNIWWSCQREHLTIWCLHQPTLGFAKFKRSTPNHSAKNMYRYFRRPETLLWLAESLGEDKHVLLEIVDEIKNIENCKNACDKLRAKIPFTRILDLMRKPNLP